MKLVSTIAAAGMILATLGAAPLAADPGQGRGNGKGHARHTEDRAPQGRHAVRIADCPPGLAKKNPPCVPPGQAGRVSHHGNRVGEVLRIGDYTVIRDPRRYDLESRRGWDYYRDDSSIYRVDSSTRKILAVLNLIDAFSQ